MLKGFFLYTRSEQRGIIVLIILILLVVIARFAMPYWMRYSAVRQMDDGFVEMVREVNARAINGGSTLSVDSLFYFNPNKVTDEELMVLGFSEYQRKAFMGYRAKVNRFEVKTDLLRVYGMDSAFYFTLEQYVVLDAPEKAVAKREIKKNSDSNSLQWINFNLQDSSFWIEHVLTDSIRKSIGGFMQHHYITKSLPLQRVQEYSDEKLLRWLVDNSRRKQTESKHKEILPVVELNGADTAQLKQLRGIGSKLAIRIINFRNALGGFYTIDQLSDVYGVSDDLFKSLIEQITVDETLVRKIDAREYTLDQINSHPYFKYSQAKDIKNLYRKNEWPTAEDILGLKSVSKQDWNRMQHYLIIAD